MENIVSDVADVASDLEEVVPTVEDVRARRINHFSRNIVPTIRYRHLIGSPSLSVSSNEAAASNTFDNNFSFDEDEVR